MNFKQITPSVIPQDSCHPERSAAKPKDTRMFLQLPLPLLFFLSFLQGICFSTKSKHRAGAASLAPSSWDSHRQVFVGGVVKRVGVTICALLLLTSTVLFAEADGKWLHRVPDQDRTRANPLAADPKAAEAGKVLFGENCAKCHGADANGLHNRPSLKSERVRHATDGELAWLLKNGNPYKGMPPWSSLPEQQRWQIISYIRTLPAITH